LIASSSSCLAVASVFFGSSMPCMAMELGFDMTPVLQENRIGRDGKDWV
jgi:hypothetical protein